MTTFPEFPANGHAFSAAETGQALAGLIRRDANGIPVPGFLGGGPKVTAVGSSWKVQVSPFTYVRVIGAQIGLSGVSADEQVDVVPAAGDVPSGQSRIDRVLWNPVTSVLSVVKGTPAVSPVAPSPGALVKVGTVRVAAGDGMVLPAQVAPDFAVTSLVGGDSGTYVPVVSGYESGWVPEMLAQFTRSGDTYDVELQAVTERVMSRVVGQIMVSTPVPIGAAPISVDGGGYFLIGPAGAKRIYEAKVRHASVNQVVVEMVRFDGRMAELVSVPAAGFAASDGVSWRVRFRFTAGA